MLTAVPSSFLQALFEIPPTASGGAPSPIMHSVGGKYGVGGPLFSDVHKPLLFCVTGSSALSQPFAASPPSSAVYNIRPL